jgi:hypothetical protein
MVKSPPIPKPKKTGPASSVAGAIELSPLEQTSWAQEFARDCLRSSYETALKYARDPGLRVEVLHTNERGNWEWAIVAVSHDTDFWMDAKATKKAATTLCRAMGWKQIR